MPAPLHFQGSGPHGRCTWKRSISLKRTSLTGEDKPLRLAPAGRRRGLALGMKGAGARGGLRGKGRHDVTTEFRWVSWPEALSKLPSGGAADGGRWQAEMPVRPW